MSDERPPDHAPAAPAPADAARSDLNSRIERRLWMLRRGPDRAEARMTVKFARLEFRVYVNGELLWSRNYAPEDRARFDTDAAAKQGEFTGSGWEVL
jgi:hypothetical protein